MKERLESHRKITWRKRKALKLGGLFFSIAGIFVLVFMANPTSNTDETRKQIAIVCSLLSAACIAADSFTRMEERIGKQVTAGAKLDRIGWEYLSLSGEFEEFKEHGEHRAGFEKFCHLTEMQIAELPAELL